MATVWKREFHVTEPGNSEPSQWFDEDQQDVAIAAARACGGIVEKVTYYDNDRTTIFDAAEAVEEGED